MNRNPDCEPASWEFQLERLLPLFGHRNWIVVADAAYPAQSNPGIETLYTGAGHIEVLQKVLDAVRACRHVRANAYLDAELDLITEADAPGVTALRDEIEALLPVENVRFLPHEQIIARLDQAGNVFCVLILKTALTIPYTSVFLELDCGYWNEEAEKRLRDTIAMKTPEASRPR